MLTGAMMAFQTSMFTPLAPISSIDASSGARGLRLAELTAISLSLPDCTIGMTGTAGSRLSWIWQDVVAIVPGSAAALPMAAVVFRQPQASRIKSQLVILRSQMAGSRRLVGDDHPAGGF